MKLTISNLVFVLILAVELFPQKMGDDYAFNINNIFLPLNRRGVLADVNVPPNGSGGQFGGHQFLLSGGFFLSGFSNGELWANGVASASQIEDYLPGRYLFGQFDPRAQLYRIRNDDEPFGQSWQDWADAVILGADFYDGDADGIYNPIDKNGNNLWDPDEDCPDLLGDEMIWCVYHDSVSSSIRRWKTVEPQGIEIKQSVFAYTASNFEALKNVIYIRYRITYNGIGVIGEPDKLDSVYFGIWDDPNIGDHLDDLVGSDKYYNAEFTYNQGPDNIYGQIPPSFFVRVFSGPKAYIPGVTFIDNNGDGEFTEGIDFAIDTAFTFRGQLLGIKKYPGAANLRPLTAVHFINGVPDLLDPDNKYEARNYMLGLNRVGTEIDPCTWQYGEVRGGVDCNSVDPRFWYFGDPVTNVGWINNFEGDQRQLFSIGPLKLKKGEEYEAFIGYSVGKGADAVTSINEAKYNSNIANWLLELNFDTTYVVSIKNDNIQVQVTEYVLNQNYPNPFNPITNISYTLPAESQVKLSVYNPLGELVETIVNEQQSAGKYDAVWNAGNHPSGVYIYTLDAVSLNGNKQTKISKKMILLK